MARDRLQLAVAGDIVMSRRLPGDDGLGEAVARTAAVLRDADVVFGDLEIPLSDGGRPREKTITFRAEPAIAGDLRRLGFDVLCLANNHSLDYGGEALADTRRHLEAAGIATLGAGGNLDEASSPLVVERNGWRIGFLAWSCLLPSGAAAGPDRPGLAPIHVHTAYEVNPYFQMEEPGTPPVVRTRTDEAERERALAAVRALRPRVDFLAVSIHWGYGAVAEPAEYQQPLGRALIDAGADVVLGNHVHAVQGVEVHRGRAILYSPGNFVAQQPREGISPEALAILDEMSPDGYLAVLELDPDGSYDLRLLPTVTNEAGLPELAAGEARARIGEALQRLSRKLGGELRERDGELRVPGLAAARSG